MLLQLNASCERLPPAVPSIPASVEMVGINDVRLLRPVIDACKRKSVHIYCCDLKPTPSPLRVPLVQGSYALTMEDTPITLSLGRPAHTNTSIHWLTNPPQKIQPPPLPYYSFPSYQRPKCVDIVGAGISGLVTAYVLAQKGIEVRIFDRHNLPCKEASGNPHALAYANLSPFDQIQPRFYMSSLFTSLHALSSIQEKNDNVFLSCGIRCSTKHHQHWRRILSPHETELIHRDNHLWIPSAGVVDPHALARCILEHPYISFFPEHDVDDIILDKGKPVCMIKGKKWKSDHIIVCTAHHIHRFPILHNISIHKSSGQISYSKTQLASNNIAYSDHAYLTPFWNGTQCFGATYHLKSVRQSVTQEDHMDNILRLKSTVSDVHIKQSMLYGRCGVRAQTNNFLPIIGPVPNSKMYQKDYAKLKDGLLRSTRYPSATYIPNLSVHIGHGSKGFSQAWLGAEILSSQLTNAPLPVDIDVYQALHPARFLVRSIHKGTSKSI